MLMVLGIVGGYLGWWAGSVYVGLDAISRYIGTNGTVPVLSKVGFAAIGVLAGGLAYTKVSRYIQHLAENLREMPANDKIALFVGALIGLLLTFLSVPILQLNQMEDRVLSMVLTLSVAVLMVFLCTQGAMSMREELRRLLSSAPAPQPVDERAGVRNARILDTNIIIDGRIADICRTGFLDGTIYVPGFVLDELQLIADSSDGLKRARGRRGLDILNAMQKEFSLVVRTYDHLVEKNDEPVDRKLVLLAREIDGIIVTNDFNLNKVAELQGVKVLNVNELANALKPVVLPGEVMTVLIIKEGREPGQGIGYLDDGTMIVVENGRRHVGETVEVAVSSVLQTVAGKMIFTNLKDVADQEDELMDRNLRTYYRGPRRQRGS